MDINRKATVLVLALGLAAPAEGLRNYAYADPVGVPTICFGSTKGVKLGDHKTTAECKALLSKEMLETINQVDRCIPGLPVNVFAAFASASYNVGTKLVCDVKKSTAARLLKTGNYAAACAQLSRWNKAVVAGIAVALPGLTTRRAAERQLCLG